MNLRLHTSPWHCFGCCLSTCWLCLMVAAHAEEWPTDPLQSFQAAHALTITPSYWGEVFTNARGGRTTRDATQYLGLLDLEIQVDLERCRSNLPGNLYLLAQNTHGRGLTQDFVGDTLVISNIDSFDNIMQVSEYWWENRWLDEDVTVRLGKQDLNTEFQHIDGAGRFVQSTFGLSPSTAFPTYPDQAVGAISLLQLTDQWQLKLGAWSAFVNGSSWGYSASDAYLLIAELERRYTLAGSGFAGVFSIGGLYESEGEIEGQSVSAVREYYVQWEQTVYQESPAFGPSEQGLALFAGFYPRIAGEKILLESIGNSAVAGLTYTGLLTQRDYDTTGLGVAWAELYQGGTNQELVTELFYHVACGPNFSLQPDLQYISSPSGVYQDAFVIGVRFEVRP